MSISGIASDDQGEKDQGQKCELLKAFETLFPQMVNAYGPGKFTKWSDGLVWNAFNETLKRCVAKKADTGAVVSTGCFMLRRFCARIKAI